MRIITGLAKGRRLVGPPGVNTRPMQDRVKEALFSSLGAVVVDAAVVDLYAGTGSMGLEALSRGAASCVFVESEGRALGALETNIAAVGLGGVVVRSDVERFLRGVRGPFDVAFVDPPYQLDGASVDRVLEALAEALTDGATVIVHRRKGERAPGAATLALVDERSYGSAQLWRLEKETQ